MRHDIHYNISTLSDLDIYLFKEGKHTKLYEKFGAHKMEYKARMVSISLCGHPMHKVLVSVVILMTMQ